MNRKFLAVMMAMVLSGSILTGCGASNKNAAASEEVEVVIEETTEDTGESEKVEVVEEETTNEETSTEIEETVETKPEDKEEIVESIETESVTDDEGVYGEVDPSVAQEMLFVITDGIDLPARANMDTAMFKDTYGITTNHLSSYVVSTPMMNVHATEIAVFEVVDEAGRKAVKAGIEKRVKALKAQWETYLPAQYELVKNYKVVDRGNYVLFVISDAADAIINKFNTADL